jgi:hypothetical protein
MLHADTNVIMASGKILKISEVKSGDYVKTPRGDKKVISVESGEDFFSKFILSDGVKLMVSDGQKFLTPAEEWISVSKVQEGCVFRKPGGKSVKVIDITPIQSMIGYNLVVEGSGSFILSNGLSSK